jgi:hypothetical protein
MKPLISIHKDRKGRHVVNVEHIISEGVGHYRNGYFMEMDQPFDRVAGHFFDLLSEELFEIMTEKIPFKEAKERLNGMEVKYKGFEYSFKDSPLSKNGFRLYGHLFVNQ